MAPDKNEFDTPALEILAMVWVMVGEGQGIGDGMEGVEMCFLASVEMTILFSSLIFVNVIYHIDLWMSNHTCIPEINPT